MSTSTITIRGYDACPDCGKHLHEHDKERVYPVDSPAGCYKYSYECPGANDE